jgi:hydrogenase large subunit
MSRRIVGPFNRVEGDLEVQLDIHGDRVRDAWVVSPLYRGFEQILHGKDPRDAMVYTPRICGICSVSQSVAAAMALADAQGLVVPENGELAINLILANENVADHLTHFYLFFMPDFAREVYAAEPWHTQVATRFRAVSGTAARQVLPARSDFMHLMGLLAGKWPHSLAIQPGGSTRSIEVQEQMRVSGILFAFRRFLESTLFGDTLENMLALDSREALGNWATRHPREHSDFCRFLHLADALHLDELGKGSDTFMSYGVYPGGDGHLFGRGVWKDGGLAGLDPALIREDLSHSWMAQRRRPRHPYDGVTVPDVDASDGYTWCKAPRLDGRVVEVGALARQVVDGLPLIRDLVGHSGGNVRNRVIARLLEIARVVVAMEGWASRLQPGEPFCTHAQMPEDAMGCGMIEAARGSLGHWLKVSKGRILNYQIIAPTTWNFSPRDAGGTPGALEQALLGAPLRPGEKDPVAVQHIVRSFDPCMVCTVH